jgi:hypothetical protein
VLRLLGVRQHPKPSAQACGEPRKADCGKSFLRPCTQVAGITISRRLLPRFHPSPVLQNPPLDSGLARECTAVTAAPPGTGGGFLGPAILLPWAGSKFAVWCLANHTAVRALPDSAVSHPPHFSSRCSRQRTAPLAGCRAPLRSASCKRRRQAMPAGGQQAGNWLNEQRISPGTRFGIRLRQIASGARTPFHCFAICRRLIPTSVRPSGESRDHVRLNQTRLSLAPRTRPGRGVLGPGLDLNDLFEVSPIILPFRFDNPCHQRHCHLSAIYWQGHCQSASAPSRIPRACGPP